MPLKSTAAGDVVAAARQSALFRNHQTAGDGAHDLSHLGAPVFVRALRPAGMDLSDAPDFYVIPVLDTTGATTDAAELELNPQHTAIHVIAIVSYNTPRPSGAIAQMRAEDAAAVAARANVAPLRAAPPALVYFPADATAQQTGQIVWRAGRASSARTEPSTRSTSSPCNDSGRAPRLFLGGMLVPRRWYR